MKVRYDLEKMRVDRSCVPQELYVDSSYAASSVTDTPGFEQKRWAGHHRLQSRHQVT